MNKLRRRLQKARAAERHRAARARVARLNRWAERERARLDEERHMTAWDELYERQAAHARSNDFAETGGRDWT